MRKSVGKKWKPTGNPMGAPVIQMINVPENGKVPEKVIDFNQVIYWAELQSTQEEVAGSFRVSVETLNSRLIENIGMTYSDLRKRVDGNAKMSLRRNQFKQSEKNATMAIWLGKNWLGQRDNQEVDRAPLDANLNFADAYIKSEHERAQLAKELQALREEINALKSKTDSVIQRSDEEIQHMGGSSQIGQDLFEHSEINQHH